MARPRSETGQSALARYWGVTHGYVSNLVAKGKRVNDPLPLDDFKAADAWRAKYSAPSYAPQSVLQQAVSAANTAALVQPTIPALDPHIELDLGVGMDSLERLLRAAWMVQASAFDALEKAKRSPTQLAVVGTLTKAYNESSQRYESLQKSLRIERTAREQLISLDDHKIQLNRLVIPIIMLIRKLPRDIAVQIFPEMDVKAEAGIAEIVEKLIKDLKKALTYDIDPEFHWKCYLVAALERDPTGQQALATIDRSRVEVLGALKL